MSAPLLELMEQREQLSFESRHLLLGFAPGFGLLHGSTGAQPSNLRCKSFVLTTEPGDLNRQTIVLVSEQEVGARELIVLSRKGCQLLLRDPRSSLGLIALVLADLRPIAPKTGSDALSSLVHGRGPLPKVALRPWREQER